jgi:hypothetical protein
MDYITKWHVKRNFTNFGGDRRWLYQSPSSWQKKNLLTKYLSMINLAFLVKELWMLPTLLSKSKDCFEENCRPQ